MQLPVYIEKLAGKEQAVVLDRVEFTSDVVAVCRYPNASVAVLALASGSIRFLDLDTGKAACKALKLEAGTKGGGSTTLAALGPRRVAAVRQDAQATEFFVVEMEAGETPKAVVCTQGRLGGLPAALPSLQAFFAAGGQDRLLLSWGETSGTPSFASVELTNEVPVVERLPAGKQASPKLWFCVKGHLAELTPEKPGNKGSNELELAVRDARFGMPVDAATLPLATSGKTQLLHATAGALTVLVGATAASLAVVRLDLPAFTLQALIGARAAEGAAIGAESAGALAPLAEAVQQKRPRDDPAVEELFSAKRRATTDRHLAVALEGHTWGTPSHELVDLVVRKKCLASARALLNLPELDEDLSVRLLGAEAEPESELLALLVRRAATPKLLEAALADHLPAKSLPGILEALLTWINAYLNYPDKVVQEYCPSLPSLPETIRFMSALADGCLPSLLRLDANLLERVKEALFFRTKASKRVESEHATIRAAVRLSTAEAGAERKAPIVEAVLLDF